MKIGIIGAMDIEVEALKADMTERSVESVSGMDMTCGRLCGADVVVAKCGIGKVFAALCAQTMILKYGVDIIINTGVAGSLSPELGIGDIAVSTACVQHDMDTSPIGDPLGLISGIDLIELPADKELGAVVCRAAESLGIKTLCGIIASGDCFVSSSEKKKFITDTFGGIACEMEGGAIAQACFINGVRYVVIRAISDSADGEADMSYAEFARLAADRSEKVVKLVLSELSK